MTRDEFYRSYLEDPLLVEKNYITPEQVQNLRIVDLTDVRILEVIKIAINGDFERDSEGITTRKINTYLNGINL